MEKKAYLNEERYQKSKKKIMTISIIILVVGILVGGSILLTGLVKEAKINEKYSDNSKTIQLKKLNEEKEQIEAKMETEKQNFINKKTELEEKIKPTEEEITKLTREAFTGLDDAYYKRQDQIKKLEQSILTERNLIEVIDKIFDTEMDYTRFDDVKNNAYTSNYCALKREIEVKNDAISDIDSDFAKLKKSESVENKFKYYITGGNILLFSIVIASMLLIIAKGREIKAFGTQQGMPIVKEGIETLNPTFEKTAGAIAKGVKDGIKEDKK